MREWWHRLVGRRSFRAVYRPHRCLPAEHHSVRVTHWEAENLVGCFGGRIAFDPEP